MNIRRFHVILLLVLVVLLALPTVVWAAEGTPPPQPTLALPGVQVWALIAGAIVPLFTYLLNHYAPWTTEPVKGLVLLVVAAGVGGLTDLIDTGDFALNVRTLEVVLSAMGAAVLAHTQFYTRAGINQVLKGGTNYQDGTLTGLKEYPDHAQGTEA